MGAHPAVQASVSATCSTLHRRASRGGSTQPSSLKGPHIHRVAPRVFAVEANPGLRDLVDAHLMTLPDEVLVDGLTALQLDGIDVGPPRPLRFCSAAGRDVRRPEGYGCDESRSSLRTAAAGYYRSAH